MKTPHKTTPPQTFRVVILTVSFGDSDSACPYEVLMVRQKVLAILCDSFINSSSLLLQTVSLKDRNHKGSYFNLCKVIGLLVEQVSTSKVSDVCRCNIMRCFCFTLTKWDMCRLDMMAGHESTLPRLECIEISKLFFFINQQTHKISYCKCNYNNYTILGFNTLLLFFFLLSPSTWYLLVAKRELSAQTRDKYKKFDDKTTIATHFESIELLP